MIARNFEVLGHEDLGLEDSNADVWVHGNFAYVGTALSPCSGRGVKIVDVSNVREPKMSGTLAGRAGTSAEDMVVRTVSAEFFKGDLLAVGIQGPCTGTSASSRSTSATPQSRRCSPAPATRDFDPRSPAHIRFPAGSGIANESHHAAPLWLEPGHRVKARVVMADNQGCNPDDYPANTAGKIAVARFPFPFFDPGFVPGVSEEPLCFSQQQDAAAAAAGAVAVVHDFVAESTSPQFLDFEDFGKADIPALFTDHATAQGMVAAGKAELRAQRPTWGYLRIFDSATGKQVAKFDKAPNVGALLPPAGFWSIHNTEVAGDRAYSSW